MICKNTLEDDLEAVHITQYDPALKVIPALRGKISSLEWNGRPILVCNPRKSFHWLVMLPPFSAYDARGFDECFPTIGQCFYLEPPLTGVEVQGEIVRQESR